LETITDVSAALQNLV